MAYKCSGRDIIVSRIEVYPDDIDWCKGAYFPKTVGKVTVNTKEKTVAYDHISGMKPPLYVLIAIMGANKHWMKIVSESDIFDDGHLIMTSWRNNLVAEEYLAYRNEEGMPVVEKTLARYDALGGIENLVLTPQEYILLLIDTTDMETWSRKRKLRWLIKEREFRYIK